MNLIKVITGKLFVQDLPDEFYFSSPTTYGGKARANDQVAVLSEATGNILALGKIIDEGKPYEECKTVSITKRFS